MLERALARYKKALGLDNPNTLKVIQNLEILYYRRGQVKEVK